MTRISLMIFLVTFPLNLYCQDQDTIINFLEGKWEWLKTGCGGYQGGSITPEDSGFNITIEFNALHNDSVDFYFYKNDTLIWDTITTIFYCDLFNTWSINKNVVPIFKKYFYLFAPNDMICFGIGIYNLDSIEFYQPQLAESPGHLFIRKLSSVVQQIEHKPEPFFHPNPVAEQLHIEGLPEKKLSIEICDITGRKIYHRNIMYTESTIINTSGLQQGIYLVRIINPDTKEVLISQRIIKE